MTIDRDIQATTPTKTPGKPPAWFVHTAWRIHRLLYRITGGRFLWTTANKRK
jgi:deazaflavin-dependent oxidoreductase (nitroreductase family)